MNTFPSRAIAAFVVAIGLFILGVETHAEGDSSRGSFAAGLTVGDPAGLSLSAEIGRGMDLRGLVGWDLRSPGGPVLALDGLVPFPQVDFVSVPLVPYAGLGFKATFLVGDGRFGSSPAERGFGIRLPLGVRHAFGALPLEAILELAPGLRWYPDFAFDFDAALGARILF